MAIFEARVRKLKFTFSPFSAESMLTIGQVTLDSIVKRIQSVTDVTDSPAKPLAARYAQEKREGRYVAMGGNRKYSGAPHRDWTLRGRTLQSLKVKYASAERVTIGPTMAETAKIILARNKWDHMWGFSPKDREAMYAVMRATLLQVKRVIRITRVA
jgi:hypothetical protein